MVAVEPAFIKNEPSPITTITSRLVFNAIPNPTPIAHPIAPLTRTLCSCGIWSKSLLIEPRDPTITAFGFF